MGNIAGKNITKQDMKSFLSNVPGSAQNIVEKLNTLGQNSAFSIVLPSEDAFDQVFNDSF